jgi:putative aldouronate transport system permease protein
MKQQRIGFLDIASILTCGFFALVCFFPLYYVFINTISDNQMVSRGDIVFVPAGIHFRNYLEIFKIRGIGRAVGVSVARTVTGTLFTLLSASFLGYCMIKQEYLHRKFWYRFLIVTMYFNAGLIPWYLTMNALKLTNNFMGYVLPALVSPFNMILIKTYMETIPASLEESAELDGAGYIMRYIKIILPLAKPILATVAVFSAVGQWNSFMDTVYLMTDSRLHTLQFVLYRFLHETDAIAAMMRVGAGSTVNPDTLKNLLSPKGVRFAVTMVTMLPILMVYPFMQRYFVKGIMIGAIKG